MFHKIISVFENHIEKIVLIIAGVICAWLFITNILINPNSVELVRGGKTEKSRGS